MPTDLLPMDEESITPPLKRTNVVIVDRILLRAGRHHFAFLRAYLDGLDIRKMAKLYLESALTPVVSIPETMQTLNWIRRDLATIARRHGKFAYARIINIEPDQLKTEVDGALPTLEQFREDRDPDEFYTEKELLELFQDEFGTKKENPKQVRNLRLLKKQIAALNWLEGMVAIDPLAIDSVSSWLMPSVAERLVAAGIITLQDLLDRINGRGHKWHDGVDQLGAITAARIVKWLSLYTKQLGDRVGQQALVKRSQLNIASVIDERPMEHGIVPIEFFDPRPDLDGSMGINRGITNRSGVNTDYDAIHLWLAQADNKNTYRSYRKEAERFLLWSVLERGKALSSLLTDDCLAYKNFLRDLGRMDSKSWSFLYKIPQEDWLGRRGTERWSALWRPFEKPPMSRSRKCNDPIVAEALKDLDITKVGVLSPASQKLTHTILKSMCDYLMRQRYLDFNPFDGVKAPKRGMTRIDIGRSFTMEQWEFVNKHLDTLAKDAHYYRLRFLLHFAYETGLRISEIVAAKIGDIKEVTIAKSSKKSHILTVVGKGDKEREVVITDFVMKEFNLYLEHRSLDARSPSISDRPIIDVVIGINFPNPKVKKQSRLPTTNLSINALHSILKKFFDSVAVALVAVSTSDARHMAKASTHWLRHTCGSHAAANGIPVQILQAHFGHSSIDTTTIYTTTERDVRINAMEEFSVKMKDLRAPDVTKGD